MIEAIKELAKAREALELADRYRDDPEKWIKYTDAARRAFQRAENRVKLLAGRRFLARR